MTDWRGWYATETEGEGSFVPPLALRAAQHFGTQNEGRHTRYFSLNRACYVASLTHECMGSCFLMFQDCCHLP